MKRKRSGVYSITCLTTLKVYVGSAVDLYTRWHVHKHLLNAGTHHSRHLQHAWRKYGAGNFRFEVIENVTDAARLVAREQFWIDEFDAADPDCGYNMSPSAGSSLGVKRSKAFLLKLSKRSAKTWIVTSPTGQETTITNLFEFCKKRGLSFAVMRNIAVGRGTARTHKGWLCRRPGATQPVRPMSDGRFKPKRFTVTSPTGEQQEVVNMARFCREHGLLSTGMNSVASGRTKSHKGWVCSRIKEDTDADRLPEHAVAESQRTTQVSARR